MARSTSPFWLLALGLGTAFIVTSGRAQAIVNVLTSPVQSSPTLPTNPQTGQGTQQPEIPAVNGVCTTPGYIYDPTTGMCKRSQQA